MNQKLIDRIVEKANLLATLDYEVPSHSTNLESNRGRVDWDTLFHRNLVELVVDEALDVLVKEYRATPLECCGHFLRLEEAILDHFYGLDDAPKT